MGGECDDGSLAAQPAREIGLRRDRAGEHDGHGGEIRGHRYMRTFRAVRLVLRDDLLHGVAFVDQRFVLEVVGVGAVVGLEPPALVLCELLQKGAGELVDEPIVRRNRTDG
ncbi:hypothetical protein [Methylorubrum aminovorans]|nr:hypothetical protein [Methylorubrum aminovorans]